MFIPDYVKKVTDAINGAGEKALPVGGCVRDSIMGKIPDDYDIAVSCPPQKTEELLKDFRVIETGIKHGTVTAVSDGHNIELTTFRVDGDYRDNRHPDGVRFTDDITDDLARRDFTVNAIAYSEKDGYIDPFGGEKDIGLGIIRCVGEPDRRFSEDALRIVRGMRFAAKLGFAVEKDTALSMSRNKELLKSISAERIFAELKKLITGKNAAETLTRFSDIVCVILPELSSLAPTELDACLLSVRGASCCETAFAAMLAPLDASKTETALRRLKTDNTFRLCVMLCTDFCREYRGKADAGTFGEKEKLAFLRKFSGKHGEKSTSYSVETLRLTGYADSVAEKYVADGCPDGISVKNLCVNGKDLAKLGFCGTYTGDALAHLVDAVARGEVPNEKNALLSAAEKYRSPKA